MNIEQIREAITHELDRNTFVHGIGKKERACSIAAINIALTGEVTDDRPDCMCPVLHQWIMGVQDAIPTDMLNDGRWATLLPLAAGTNDGKGKQRLKIIMDHMWSVTLPQLQPLADRKSFGVEWARMCDERTTYAACDASRDADYAAAARAAARAAAAAADAARAAARATDADYAGFWNTADPWSLLKQLVEV